MADGEAISDADEAYLTRLEEDCERLLGPGVHVDHLDLHRNDDVVLTLRYRLSGASAESEGRGASVVEAHADLRTRLVVDRIGLGLRAMIKTASTGS